MRTGVFVNAGDLEQIWKSKGRHRRDCTKGEALPAGAIFATDLESRTIQVRDGADTVFLSDVMP